MSPSANTPDMAAHDVPCDFLVRIHDNDRAHLVNISAAPDVPQEVKARWIAAMTAHMWDAHGNWSPEASTIRPWKFIADLDGSVESLPPSDVVVVGGEERSSSGMYPAHYRIPPRSIVALSPREQIARQERFAFASLLYEIWLQRRPFAQLSDEEAQQRYANAEFPDHVTALPAHLFVLVLSNWSVEFANSGRPDPLPTTSNERLTPTVNNPLTKAVAHVRTHPYLSAVGAAGALVSTAALLTPVALGAAGFGALGPLAGSIAASWQSGIGAVQAGSLFAWCQSAAMGGAAVNGIIAAGAAGGGVAALATAGAMGRGDEAEAYLDTFRRGYRKA